MKNLLYSRKFWLLVLDTVVSALTYFVGKYVVEATAQDILYMVGILQPVFVTVIAAVAYEDGKQIQAGTHPTQQVD